MKERRKIEINGIVQGVGFRPFIYSLATQHHLNGFVLNNTKGVVIEVEGEKPSIESFISSIKDGLPPISRIEAMGVKNLPPVGYENFSIKPSLSSGKRAVIISPDIATCEKCLEELFDEKDRRFTHPFINCTNCGPRFTIIKDIPYDRKMTTMEKFKMCPICQAEYDNPSNRRFHAQPNCCPECGPEVKLIELKGDIPEEINRDNPLEKTAQQLSTGSIVAIKGLGGFHLACDATNQSAVLRLRAGKQRNEKPFALMAKDMDTIRTFCNMDKEEETLLLSVRRPIVLLKKKKENHLPVAEGIARNQNYYGVMLPYTPLHHLLFYFNSPSLLVMTSGNLREEPIIYKDKDAFSRLSKIADYFLSHNRKIHIRCDDSVTRIFLRNETLVRRARGYVPEPIALPFECKGNILSCGAELKNTFCLTKGNYAFLSQHIGDLENLETLQSFEKGIEQFKHLFSIEPRVIAYDMHPEYLSTKYAKRLSLKHPDIPTVPIQHHYAHIASCMAENGITDKVIGIAFDGTGYGTDGKIWGAEFLIADLENSKRVGHLRYIPMPGGEMAIKEPWRMAVSYLYDTYGDGFTDLGLESVKKIPREKRELVKKMISQGINSPLTSSMGRFFDAVSAMLSICMKNNYEAQAAIELEMAIKEKEEREEQYKYSIMDENGLLIIDTKELVRGIVEDIKGASSTSFISSKFHNTIVEIITDISNKLRKRFGLNKIALSGGVFQNMFLLNKTVKGLQKNGFSLYTHHRVPTNDGGISLGQAAIAGYRMKNN